MRNLEVKEINAVNGGDAEGFVDGACATVAATGLLGWTVPGLNVAKAFCTGYGIGKLITK